MRALSTLAVTVALTLACAGAPSPTPAPPTDWQQPFADKADRRVGDYLMLLPDDLLECEVDGDYREQERRDMVREKKGRFVELETPEGWRPRLAVEEVGSSDHVAFTLNCGAACRCSHQWFGVFEDGSWRELDPIDGEDIHGKVDKLGHDSWWVGIGDDGELQIVDIDNKRLLGLRWSGERLTPVR